MYNKWGLIDSEIDPRGTVTKYIYTQGTADEASIGSNPLFAPGVGPVPGHLTRIISDFGGENLTNTFKEFDGAGNPGITIGPGGRETTAYGYDAMNRLLQQSDAVGVVTTYGYDSRGNMLEQVVDPGGRPVTTTKPYNAEDQLTFRQVNDGVLMLQTTMAYDINRQPAMNEDSRGNRTLYIYDKADQLRNVIDPAGYVITYTYTLERQIKEFIDADGFATTKEYDGLGRLTSEIKDANGLALKTQFTYDLNGNILSESDPVGTITCYAYDSLDRRTAKSDDCGGLNLTTSYRFDLNGNILSETNHRGVVTRNDYDALNRLSLTMGGSILTSILGMILPETSMKLSICAGLYPS